MDIAACWSAVAWLQRRMASGQLAGGLPRDHGSGGSLVAQAFVDVPRRVWGHAMPQEDFHRNWRSARRQAVLGGLFNLLQALNLRLYPRLFAASLSRYCLLSLQWSALIPLGSALNIQTCGATMICAYRLEIQLFHVATSITVWRGSPG